MNKKLFLHIGWHKTGSTAIQHFLLRNKQKLIIQEKIYYPDEGLVNCAHHTIAWVFQNKATSPLGNVETPELGADNFFNDIFGSANQHGCNAVIISSEEFCAFRRDEIERLVLAAERNHFDVKIIAYLRRQDLFVESAYNSQVKWWRTRCKLDFSDYLKNHFPPHIDYFSIIEDWSNVLGAENIILRPFDQEKLVGGEVRTDFCSALNINLTNLEIKQERTNISLSAQTLEFLKVMNNLDLQKDEHNKVVQRLFEYDKKEKPPKCVLFTPDERIGFMDMFQEPNKNLEKFIQNLDFLTLPNEKIPEKNSKPLTVKELNKILNSISQASYASDTFWKCRRAVGRFCRAITRTLHIG